MEDKVQLEVEKNNLKTESKNIQSIFRAKMLYCPETKSRLTFSKKFEWGELFWISN